MFTTGRTELAGSKFSYTQGAGMNFFAINRLVQVHIKGHPALIVSLQRLAVLAFLVLPGVKPAAAQDVTTGPDEAGRLIAGVPRGFPPYYLVADNGDVTGFGVDVMDAVAERAGLSVEYRVFDSWTSTFLALQDGEIDVIPNSGITEDRQAWGAFSDPYESQNVVLFVRAGTEGVGSLDDLRGRTVGVVESNIAESIFFERTDIAVRSFNLVDTALDALLAGEIDALAYPDIAIRNLLAARGVESEVRSTGPVLARVQRAMLVRSDRGDLLAELEQGLRAFTGTTEYPTLYARWFAPQPVEIDRLSISVVSWATLFCFLALLMAFWMLWRSLPVTAGDPERTRNRIHLRRRAIQNASMVAALTIAGFVAALFIIYRIEVEGVRRNMAEIAEAQTALIDAVAQFDRQFSDSPETARTGTLSQVMEGLRNLRSTVMETSVAELTDSGDQIHYLARQEPIGTVAPTLVPFSASYTAPMREALMGFSGTMQSEGYTGTPILAAYRYVPSLDVGLVVEQEMREIQLPFLFAGSVVVLGGMFIALLGTWFSLRQTLGLVGRVLDSEQNLRDIFQQLAVAIRVEDWSAMRPIVTRAVAEGKDPEQLAAEAGEFLNQLQHSRRILDLSEGALKLSGANNKAEAIERFGRTTLNDDEARALTKSVSAFARGEHNAQAVVVAPVSGNGERLLYCEYFLPPAYSDTWSRVLIAQRDITAERKTQGSLLEWTKRFEVAASAARIGIFDYDVGADTLLWDDRILSLYGLNREQFTGRYDDWRQRLHPDDRDEVERNFRYSLEYKDIFESEFRIITPTNEVRHLAAYAHIERDEQGKVLHLIGINMDVSEQRSIERQLNQSQKLEAIGQLAGGIAHDFNNLLTVVGGNLELIKLRLSDKPDAVLERQLEAALHAVQSGSDLTARLLAVSKRHGLEPVDVDANELVSGMIALFERTLDADTEIILNTASAATVIRVDRGQLESAILNLAVNARDAMPTGGRLTIATEVVSISGDNAQLHPDLKPGGYVVISVSDTGTGMDANTIERVFEPFFTTKKPGKGTGLGLSMVYGFTRQSGGGITIYSEPGWGTTIRLYFPCSHAKPEPKLAVDSTGIADGGTILLVEDNDDLRETVRAMLGTLGYDVLEAESGPAALRQLEAHPEIDLLFTDIVMHDGMSGFDLVKAALKERPDLKFCYASGYADPVLKDAAGDAPQGEWLAKPYDINKLGATLARILGE